MSDTTAPFTPEQEARIREIARAEAIEVATALSAGLAHLACNEVIDRFTVPRSWLEAEVSDPGFLRRSR